MNATSTISRIRLSPCLAVILIAGCGGETAELPGVWEINRDASIAEAAQVTADDERSRFMARAAEGLIRSMDWTLSLYPDGAATLVFREGNRTSAATGTWSAEADKVAIRYASGRDRQEETLSGRVEGRFLRLEPEEPGQPALLLERNSAAELALTDPPPFGPIRSDCPVSEGEAGAPAIAGLTPGMSYDEIVTRLQCRDDVRVVQTAPLWTAPESFGLETRGMVRGADGIPCHAREAPACDTAGDRFAPLRNVTTEYLVAFTGLPGEEVARAVWSRSRFAGTDSQSIEALTTALVTQFGAPTLHATGDHSRLNRPRQGATNLVWVYGTDGSPMPEPRGQISNDAMRFEECVNGPDPRFEARQSWNSGCGMTIRAEILRRPENPELAVEFNQVVMHQRDLFHGNQQFQHALKLVGGAGN